MERSVFAKAMAAACAAAAILLCAAQAARAQINITTYHYDNLRTGWNQNETTLTQANLSSLGLQQAIALDDQVDAQPLLVTGLTINGSTHDVLYVATESNSVYAIDAESGQTLLKTNLGAPVPYYDLPGACGNNGPNVGINSTPVIDTSTGTLYTIALTLQSGTTPAYFVHALSLTTLADAVTPVQVQASGRLSNGKTYAFNAGVSRQRAALLLSGGNLYAGFASFCDIAANQSRGWVLGWQESTLAPLASNKLNDTKAKSADSFFLTSVWMSGYGLAANSAGSVFFVTGNTDYSGNAYNKVTNIAESAAEMSPDLSTLQGLFTPGNEAYLDEVDGDFGSGGLMLLPSQQGKYPDLAGAAGKYGVLYLLDADKLGKVLAYQQVGSCWCGPSYFQGSDGLGRIVTSGGSSVGVWAVETSANAGPHLVSKASYGGIAGSQSPGFFTSVSSNGTTAGTAVVWAVGRPTETGTGNIDLYAVNADTGALLFQGVAGKWLNVGGDSNTVPVVANGRVYVASDQMLTIFGLGGAKKGVSLPAVRRVDMRAPLARGEHEIYGFARSMSGSTVAVQRRDGSTVLVDVADARRDARFAEPSPGHALIARGTFEKAGVMAATTILHAVDHPAMWPEDR